VKRAAIALAMVVAGCREREVDGDPHPVVAITSPGHAGSGVGSGAAIAPAAIGKAPPRVLYPSTPGSFVELVDKARHGVVTIRSSTPVKSGPAAMFPGAPEATADVALGTGFLIDAHGVYVLTNDHIAAAASELKVVLPDHREVQAKLVGRDPRLDLALLSVDEPRLAPLVMGDSDDLQVGEWLVVLGDAFGDEVSASTGIVSATGRDVAGSLMSGAGPGRAMGFRTFLQTDARIHRGNSGGPVLDTAGQVVGVAVATGDRPGEVSFAIPINRVKEVVDSLRDTGQVVRAWLGVLVQPVDADRAQAAGLTRPSGALVTEVKAGSPAARAGLQVGDIITAWADREVDHRALPWIVAQAAVGKPINATVWRNRAPTQIAVIPDKMPE
jgi:serine protease Do